MSEPRGGAAEERRHVVEELERRTEHARRLLDEIERRRQEAERQGLNFTAPTAEQLLKKLDMVESPMIVGQGWNNATPGGTINYSVSISNPDPVQWYWLFVHVFVGPANVAPSVGEAVSAVDPRFPRLTQPRFAGLTLAAGTSQSLSFSLAVPAG